MNNKQIADDFQEYVRTAWQFVQVEPMEQKTAETASFVMQFDSGERFVVKVNEVSGGKCVAARNESETTP